MNQKLKKVLLVAVVAVVAVFVAVGLFWIFGSGLKHIEDTNGPENYKLNTITDEQIIRGDMGALNPVYIHQDLIGNGLTFSSDKFTGVHEILYDNFIGSSDFVLSLTSLTVTEGNFRMVVHDGKIVAEFEPNTEDPFVDYCLDNVSGTVSLRIVGESASYSFHMSNFDYDSHSHLDSYGGEED